MEVILAEARELAAGGARELIIVAQDTSYYGIDLYGEPRLADLLVQLDQIEGIDWIRLMYVYPMYVDARLMETIAQSSRIVPYLDLPLQHINDVMLRRMARRVTRKATEQLLDELRRRIPDLVLRTTLITGFPGETEDQFEELAQFVREARFERLGVFTYSFESNTPSAGLPDHLPELVKQQRRDHLMEIQREIAFSWNEAQLGRQLPVLLDQRVADQDHAFVGRTYADAPDVDSLVWLSGSGYEVGDLVQSEVVAMKEYDLIAAGLHALGPAPASGVASVRGNHADLRILL
jgi:ribosomal protein S12 methylthiotransferase